MRRSLHLLLATTITLGTASAGRADPPQPPPGPGAASPDAPAPKAKSKSSSKPRKRAAAPASNGPVATFSGFRVLENGGSRVYVDLTASVNVEEHAQPGVLTYTLKGARVL